MFRTITAKYRGTCKRCNGPIAAGDRIRYGGAGRTYHLKAECNAAGGADDSGAEPAPVCFYCGAVLPASGSCERCSRPELAPADWQTAQPAPAYGSPADVAETIAELDAERTAGAYDGTADYNEAIARQQAQRPAVRKVAPAADTQPDRELFTF